uniref:Uncharacterized protein n=1 Tax=Megaselia scalaris TaxID=36166 RepID=T1GWZ5_MEGSC
MICDYLVHDLKMHPLEAIQRFEAARNHKIERQNYRDFLIDGKNATIENNCETGHQVSDNMKPRSERNHYNRFTSERSDFQRRDYREGRDNQRSYRDNTNYDFEAYRHQRFNYNNDRSARRNYQGYSKGNSLEVRIPGSFRKEEKAQEYSSRRKRTSECMEDVEGMVKRKRSSEGYSRYVNRYGQSSREYSPEGTMAPRIPGTPSPDRSSNSSTQWSRYSRNAPQDQRRGIHHCPRIPRERPREDRFKGSWGFMLITTTKKNNINITITLGSK